MQNLSWSSRAWRRRVEPDAAEVAEQVLQSGSVRGGQWRFQDRFDVAAQVAGVAGAEQHDIDAGLVADITIGRIGHARRTLGMDHKRQRILGLRQRCV